MKQTGGELVVMRLRGPSGLVRSFGKSSDKKGHNVLIGEEEDESDKPVRFSYGCLLNMTIHISICFSLRYMTIHISIFLVYGV